MILDLLDSYIRRHGHAVVPHDHREGNFGLGVMVGELRQRYRRDELAPERIHILERLPGWSWAPHEDRFVKCLRLLQQYAEREGHCAVPPSHREEGLRLGAWVSAHRSLFRAGRLPGHRRAALERIEGWRWRGDRFEIAFRDGLLALRRYAEREGAALVPRDHVEDGFPLGLWVHRQRGLLARGCLRARRVSLLGRVPGWSWDPAVDRWSRLMGLLRGYAVREGHCVVPQLHEEDGQALGRWVSKVRCRYREGRLSQAQVRELEALPGWAWDAAERERRRMAEARFAEGLAHLWRFAARVGHLRVPPGARPQGYPLGAWVVELRRLRSASRLTADQVRTLESLPGWSWQRAPGAPHAMVLALRRLVARRGSLTGPLTEAQRGWIQKQRGSYRRGQLAESRIADLEALPGWTWEPFRDRFEEGVGHLRRFAQEHGHLFVAQSYRADGFALGQWVGTLRMRRKRGELKREQVIALDKLPGWSWTGRPRRGLDSTASKGSARTTSATTRSDSDNTSS